MMRRACLTACVVLVCVALGPGAALADAQATPLAFAPCKSSQVIVAARGLQCATLNVPLDRADPALGNVALAVQRVPASAPRVGVIVLLAGGPGQPALPPFEQFLAPLAGNPALRGYELVSFDQRGTGQSGALKCRPTRETLRGLRPGESLVTAIFGACGTALGASRAYYTSQESVEDLDALRQALGGTPLSLFAVSYGGRVAGMYAHEHNEGVARMVLDSPTPLGGSGALYSDRMRALRRVLDQGICGAGACDTFSSDVYADLTRLVERLHRGPLHTRIFDAAGRLHRATVTERGLLRLLLGLDVAPATREIVPAAISAVADGNAAPLARLTDSLQDEISGRAFADSPASLASAPTYVRHGERLAKRPPPSASEISVALFVATYCVENELPWSPDSAPAGRSATLKSWLASQPAGITAPFALSTVASGAPFKLCLGWPATPPAPPPPTGVSATPTLILSGDDDLRTSYEQDVMVAAGYSDVQLLRIPGTGHSTVSTDRTGCAKNAMIAFLATGQAPASCPPPQEPLALTLPPASLGAVAPAASHSRLAGRAAAAVAITLEDLLGQTAFSGGGLRGGYWTRVLLLRQSLLGISLHRMVDVPGVAVSGSIALTEDDEDELAGHLTVRGRVSGSLTLRGHTLSGRLNGARVQARLSE